MVISTFAPNSSAPRHAIVSRNVPPPDFRYVGLAKGPSKGAINTAISGIGAASLWFALCSAGAGTSALAVSAGAAILTTLAIAKRNRREHRHAHEVAMVIVPWGVIIAPDDSPRILRWPAVADIQVDMRSALRGGTPHIVESYVTVHTEREIFAARANGAVGLERLIANLKAYTDEASRPISSDLDGREALCCDVSEPSAHLLLQTARSLLSSSLGAQRLSLPAATYREAVLRKAGPDTRSEILTALRRSSGTPCDPRPLAAIVAALLGARELIPELILLSNSPHPLVSAFAKASALKLGAPKARTGTIDELAAFLPEEDLDTLQNWSGHPSPIQ